MHPFCCFHFSSGSAFVKKYDESEHKVSYCTHLGNTNQPTVEGCQDYMLTVLNANVFNYNSAGSCTVRNCADINDLKLSSAGAANVWVYQCIE